MSEDNTCNGEIAIRSGIVKNSEKAAALLKFVKFQKSKILDLNYVKLLVGQAFDYGQIVDLSNMILKIEGKDIDILISNDEDWKNYFEKILNTNEERNLITKNIKIKFYSGVESSSISLSKNSKEEIKGPINFDVKSKLTDNINEKILENGFDTILNDKTIKDILLPILKNKLSSQFPELKNTEEKVIDKQIMKTLSNVYENHKLTKLLIEEHEENPDHDQCLLNLHHNDSDIQSFSNYYNDKNIKEFSSSLFLNNK